MVGSTTVLVVRTLAAWRNFRSFSRRTAEGMDRVARGAAAAEAHAAALGTGSERLTSAVADLQRSLEQLAVLQAAAGDVRAAVARVRGAVPGK
jgi:hypothetical protein